MNVPIVEPDTKKERIGVLVDYFTVNKDNHMVSVISIVFLGSVTPVPLLLLGPPFFSA
jgi:hypothetical protein